MLRICFNRFGFALAVAWLTLLSGCTRIPDTGVTPLKPATLAELQGQLLTKKADVDQFRLRGPYAVTIREDQELRLSAKEIIEADLYLSEPAEKAPLVILLHGHENSKEDHAYQAMHLATWGMHSMTVQLPNKGPWVRNGEILARIVNLIHARPEMIDKRIDPQRIVLIGHSFGGSAVAIALAVGARAAGGVLLDPAGVGRAMPAYLRKIRSPVMVIGADGRIALTRNREYFYAYIRSDVADVSITDAHHEDAQFSLEPLAHGIASDSSATEEMQISFVAALTSAAISLGLTGKLDYAWTSYGEAIRSGKLFDPLRK